VNTKGATQVVETALENNITADGLEAFMTGEVDGIEGIPVMHIK
jgi:hypothetical protein